MSRYRDKAPREIVVKHAAVCAETGKPLPAGAAAIYYPTSKKLYHPDSQQAGEFRSAAFSAAWGMADANW